jgi:glycosyltransferase involved in cell wall biosynthesis
MARISCIIPAYNEGSRIAGVLTAVIGHPLLDEIIVVDDGSTDETQASTMKFENVRLLVKATNVGKSGAICMGVRAATGDLLVLLDADLVGLTKEDVTKLILPVLQGDADASISLRRDALPPWRAIGLDYLSGERVLHRSVLTGDLDAVEHLPGYGLESYINEALISRKSRLKVIWWQNVGHTYKVRKYGLWKGILGEARMLMNIVETISLAGTAHQIVVMLRQRV